MAEHLPWPVEESAGRVDPTGRALEVIDSLAAGSYLLGRLGASQAASLAGMTEETFLRLVQVASQAATGGDVRVDGQARPLISVIVPVFNEQDNLVTLHQELSTVLAGLGTHEVIFVDDGSSDGSVETILDLRARDPSVKLLRLSRNFGHQAALSAGLDHARGEAVAFMDADHQDPPDLLVELTRRWHEGYEVVYAVRTKRKEGVLKRSAYFFFYRLLQRLAEMDIPLDAGDYCLIDRRVADALRALPERNRFLRGLRSWVGFRQCGVTYDRPARRAGEPKYTTGQLVKLALDGLLAFSTFPLRMASYVGFLTAAGGVAYTLVAVLARVFTGEVPAGWTSIIAILLTVSGVQLIMTGVVGEYLARTYAETKGRPLYLIRDAYGLSPRR